MSHTSGPGTALDDSDVFSMDEGSTNPAEREDLDEEEPDFSQAVSKRGFYYCI